MWLFLGGSPVVVLIQRSTGPVVLAPVILTFVTFVAGCYWLKGMLPDKQLDKQEGGGIRWAQRQYDLTGNVSGICPECGTPVLPSEIDGS